MAMSTSTSFLTSPPTSLFKNGICKQRFVLLKVNCDLEGSKRTVKSESETTSSCSAVVDENDRVISAYRWCAALGGVGFLETAYLTLSKLTDSDALCPIGEGSCNAVLNSDFASVFGVPLPLYDMVAYGLVAVLGLRLQLVPQKTAFDVQKKDEMILIGITTSMAVATAYFLYILSTEFGGESCLYCLTSSALTFSLFFITLKNFGFDKIQKMLGSQLCIASLVIIALSVPYNVVQPVSSSLAAAEILPYVEREITKESSPLAISLARHLRSIGAKLYGAFWCSHCVHQKEMFGHEAAKLLDYIECYPDGVKEGTKMAEACFDADLKYFPSWEINGQVLSGEKQFAELAKLSGIKLEDLSQQN